MIQFRDYQETAIDAARSLIGRGTKRIMINAPTGAGKTVIAAGIVQRAVSKGKTVLFLAHRRELIDQTVNKLVDAGVLNFGVVMAGNRLNNASAPVQVASIQTLIRRELPPADLVIIDEAHRSASRSYISMLANYPRAVVLGLSATPERLDGKGLDDIFSDMIVVETVPNLIERGYLIKPDCYAGPTADLTGVRIKRGDYDEQQLAEAMDKPKLVGDIVATWTRLAKGRQTVAFASSVAHADHIAAEFRAAGVSAAMVSGETKKTEREAVIADWKAGHIQVVANAMIFTEGFDYPELEACILARPTKSVSLFLQCVGRIMRPAQGKADAMVLDHAGCCQMHGPPHIDRAWALEGMAAKRKKDKDDGADLRECETCSMLYAPAPKLWLAETQPRLRDAFTGSASEILRGATKRRAMDACPGCGSADCIVCGSTFHPKTAQRDIDGIARESFTFCPQCMAHYVDETPHMITDPTETAIPECTDEDLVRIGDEAPINVVVLNEYKRLINEARKAGRKRGWAYWRLRERYDEDVLRAALPRHTGGWWKGQA
ncbi:MAG: DEAD/DEAH box helicase [Gammaproteobacteria bacterium]|nr:DEAD/DEAH box helicase [Gammaproteobacteria bacterium]